ncbi:Major Facilitator Superfamily transporter [Frankia canadensis]|uniref:Major Facilitator Superfamily transporter n=1 Tax=Frankia canadensis TaxID=1836972 RepID=A0A2I2KQ04_9ACTN|nr:MFS transporter [Frankia canadensis]SNQ47745.1 Major Facilitator Superfamily transporter [Frankia canadensis]SOU55035.1 Major Facilitator Superfamily transporter [Frankia canadensis]
MSTAPPRPNPGRTLAVLLLASMAFALAQTTVVPAIPVLARELRASVGDVTWTMSGYLVAAAILTPVIGRLGDMVGKRRMLVVSLAVFALGGVVAALAGQLWVVIAGRILQGAGGGVIPLCFGIIRDEFPPHRRPASIGLISAMLGIGGGLGLVLGGLLVDHATYHWIFWSGAAMAALAALSAQLLVPESPNRVPGRIDLVGTLLLGVGVALPLVGISQAKTWGWTSATTLGLIVAGVAVLGALVAFERRQAEPLINMTMLAQRPVLITNISTVLVGFGMFGAFLLIPQLAQTPKTTGYGFGTDATTAGLLMVPGSLAMLVTAPLAGVIAGRWGGRIAVLTGSLVTAAGLALLATVPDSRLALVLMGVVAFAGIGLVFAAIPNLVIDAVAADRTGEATGVNTLLRSIGSSLGSQICASILVSQVDPVTGIPTADAYQIAFLFCAVIAVVAGLSALGLPRSRTGAGAPAASADSRPAARDSDEVGAARSATTRVASATR